MPDTQLERTKKDIFGFFKIIIKLNISVIVILQWILSIINKFIKIRINNLQCHILRKSIEKGLQK